MGIKLWKIWRILFYGMVAEILGYLALFVVSMFIRIPHDIYMGIVIGLGAKDFKEICENIKSIFEKEKSSRRACWCLKDFKEWGAGLPSILDTWPLLCDGVDILGDILEETEEERSKYDGSQAWDLMAYLIFREIDKAVRA